jgi:hypothetical protein
MTATITRLPLAQPRVLSDATRVLANPAAHADQPTLVHLARLVAASAQGAPLHQLRRGNA